MNEHSIVKSITKHIIPFQYNKSYSELIEKFKNRTEFMQTDDMFKGAIKIHKYIKENCRGENSGCKYYKLKENTIVDCFVDISKRRNRFMKIEGNSIDGKKETFKFNISDIEVIIFNSQIGFLVINYEIDEEKIENYVKANYFLQAIKTKKIQKIEYSKKVGKNEFETNIISLTEVMDIVLSHIDIISFMEKGSNIALNKPELFYPIEALVYSLILMDNDKTDQEWIKQQANLISKGYKSTYKISTEDINQGIIQGFNNLIWSVSREGVSNISQLVDNDDITNEFLCNNISPGREGNITSIYFHIYLLLLNQRYSLIAIADKINKDLRNISEEMLCKSSEEKIIEEKLIKIRFIISKLTLTGMYYDISSNSQYNRYYSKLRDSIGIDELHRELNVEISGLDTLTKIINQKNYNDEKSNQEKKQKNIQKITKIGAFVAAIALSADLSDITKQILNDFSIDYSGISVTALVVSVLIIGSLLIVACISSINKKQN